MAKLVSKTFNFCPSCGEKPETVGRSPFQCESCDFNFYFSPATAVGGIIVNRDNDILLLVRARDPGKGKFGLPGGFADAGETLEDSLIREIVEETSLAVTKAKYLCSFPNVYTYRKVTVNVLDAFYVCEVDSFEGLKAEPSEVQAVWSGKPNEDVLSKMAFESNRRALELFLGGNR